VQGREVEVGEGEISLGRSQSANVSVKDASVSRNHALMQAKSGRLTVKDLNSSNGTFLNGMRIFAEAELHDGDLLTLGESEMRVRILPPESVAATMRIDPRALLAGEELRLQAEEEAKAALVPGAVPSRSPLPPPPSAVSHVPRSPAAAPARVPPPAADLSAPASIETGPTPLPVRPVPVAPPPAATAPPAQPAALAMAPPPAMPPMAAAVAMPPLAPPAPVAAPAPPPLPRHEPAPRPSPPSAARPSVEVAPAAAHAPALAVPAISSAAVEPAAAEAGPGADAFAFPDLDLPPLPPVEVTKVTGSNAILPRAAPVIALTTRPAGFWLRAVAVVLDSLLLGLICGGIFFATGSVLDDEQRIQLVSVLWFGLDLAMRLVGWSLWGTTPGKRLLGLYVFPAGSQKPGIGFGKGLLRCLGYWASGATLGVGFLMVAFTQGKRGLHDMIAGTTVGKTTRAA
jgi:uncharacterized RDD family membrane protein YckC